MRPLRPGKAFGWWCALVAVFVTSLVMTSAQRSGAARTVAIDADDIGGVVTSAKGPEAGVWVIAETNELPTKFVRIVVTDGQGRYVLPDLPKATYEVFVRGYGLVDSPRVPGRPGQQLDLTAVVAPDARAAAQVYPANYWLNMVQPPPGKTVARATCGLACHQMGNKKTREIQPELGKFATTLDAWDARVSVGPLGATMQGAWRTMGEDRKVFAQWTDDISAGKSPVEAPPRPSGFLRNVVMTEWDWATPKSFVHTITATVPFNIKSNANGRVWGTSNASDIAVWVDPKTNATGAVTIRSEAGTMMKINAPSPDWGDENIWQPHAQPRSPALDSKGRVFFAAAFRGTLTAFGNGQNKDNQQMGFCKTGSSNQYAQYFPLDKPGGKQVGILDPKENTQTFIDTCFTTDHSYLDPDGTLWFGQDDLIGWVNINTFDKTHNSEASQGWAPAILDTNGDGRITKPWTEPDQPIDPTKDHRLEVACYSIATSPVDGSIWCAGRSRHLFRFERGKGGPDTFKAEVFTLPDEAESNNHGVEIDANGVAWQNHSGSQEFTRFDRSKCKSLTGPKAATGTHCPEGWTVYKKREQKSDANDSFYLMFLDREDVLGLGVKNVPYTGATNSDSVIGLNPETGKWFSLRVPYPMGFFTRSLMPRIDDPKTGWKGRGLWTNYSSYTPWHTEGGKAGRPKVIKVQLRPDPLAK